MPEADQQVKRVPAKKRVKEPKVLSYSEQNRLNALVLLFFKHNAAKDTEKMSSVREEIERQLSLAMGE